VRKRRFDPIAVLSLIAIVIGIGTSGLPECRLRGRQGVAVHPRFGWSSSARSPRGGDDLPARTAVRDRRRSGRGRRLGRALVAAGISTHDPPDHGGLGLRLAAEAVLRVIVAFTLPVTTSTILSPASGSQRSRS